MLCQNMYNFHNKYKSDGRNISSRHKQVAPRLKSSLQNCYDRQDPLVDSYEISLNQIAIARSLLHRFIFSIKTITTLLRWCIVRSRNYLLFASILVYPVFFLFCVFCFSPLLIFLCWVVLFHILFVFVLCLVCHITSVSGWSILDRPFSFL